MSRVAVVVIGLTAMLAGMGTAAFLFLTPSPTAGLAPKPHHTGRGFRNLHGEKSPGFLAFMKWRWDRLWMETRSPDSYSFSLAGNDGSFLRSNHSRITLTWIGHATVLLQIDGKNILTDPQFSERASPFGFIGPKRVVPPGVTLEKLPRIDAVVISHDHYDSLDTATLEGIHARPGGDKTTFFVPLGLKRWFAGLGIHNVVEMDWWDRQTMDGLEIICVPAHHWSQRVPFVRNTTLWSGWVVKSQRFSFFFAGDSGYTPHFKEIGEKFGPFDLSAIPIGAYEPRWFMRHHHLNPEDAVKVHQDVRSRKSVGIHWGTFILSDEPVDEPPRALEAALKQAELSQDEFIVLQHGATMLLEPQ